MPTARGFADVSLTKGPTVGSAAIQTTAALWALPYYGYSGVVRDASRARQSTATHSFTRCKQHLAQVALYGPSRPTMVRWAHRTIVRSAASHFLHTQGPIAIQLRLTQQIRERKRSLP